MGIVTTVILGVVGLWFLGFLLECWNAAWKDTTMGRIPRTKSFVLPKGYVEKKLAEGKRWTLEIEDKESE